MLWCIRCGLLTCVLVQLCSGGGAYCCELASAVPSVLVVSNQRIEYGVALYSRFIINLNAPLGYLIDMEFFKSAHHSSFFGIMDYIHDVFHGEE